MADSSFIIDILANVEKSVASIKGFAKSVDKEVSQINKTFASIGTAATGALAAIGVGFSLKAAIDEASQYEQAVKGLEIALQSSGVSADSASANFVDYASSLQQTTKFSDDAVLSTASLIQSIARLPTDQLKQATKASLDLATALRIDVDSAARLVSKAAEGNVTALKKYGVEVKKGTTDAETFANALSVLQSRFGGSAEKSVNTYAGATAQLTNNALDALKAFGLLIIQNKELVSAIKATSDRFAELAESIKKNEGPISAIINGSVALLDILRKITLGFSAKEFEDLFPTATVDTIDEAIISAKKYRLTLEETRQNQELVLGKQADAAREKLVADTEKSISEVKNSLKNAGKSQIQVLLDNREEQLRVISQGQKLGLVPIQEANKLRLDSQRKFESELDKILATSKEKKKQDEERAQKELEQARSRQGAIASGFINNIQQGAAGVVNAMQSLTALAVDTLLPGFGGVAATLLGFLAQGPDAVKAQIQAFIDNIPLIIDNIVLAIPAVIDALAANSGKIAVALSLAMPVVATRLAIELVKQTPTIAKSFVDSLVAEAGRLITAIADGVKQAISQATGLGGGGGPLGALGGVGGSIAGIGKKLKFASGGVVPQGFPNDSFPIMAQSGEGIVPNDTMRRLDQYLMRADGAANSSGGGGTTIIKLVVGEQELANVLLNLNRQGFRV